ncbi:MAG: hypothetical protein PF501_02670 [Salinisphaera sp.]|jgi:hypothetical protein|nr:hypothetical protein [Salinisphaera sp.]
MKRLIAIIGLTLSSAGCATYPPYGHVDYGYSQGRYGTVYRSEVYPGYVVYPGHDYRARRYQDSYPHYDRRLDSAQLHGTSRQWRRGGYWTGYGLRSDSRRDRHDERYGDRDDRGQRIDSQRPHDWSSRYRHHDGRVIQGLDR